MNRLTKRLYENVYYTKGKYPPTMETGEVRECMQKLAAYEDTGLEPEDVEQLYSPSRDIVKLVVNNRELNNKYNTLLEMYDKLQNKLKSIDGWNTALEEQFEKDGKELKKYRDLEEQGRLIKLPCEFGTSIWYIIYCEAPNCSECGAINETCIKKYKARIVEHEFIPCFLNDFGKTVFLTREEAEKTLEPQDV